MAKLPKFTMRRGGERMADTKITVTISEAMVDWLAKAKHISRAAAFAMIRDEADHGAYSQLSWHRPRVDKDGILDWVHVDDDRLEAGERAYGLTDPDGKPLKGTEG